MFLEECAEGPRIVKRFHSESRLRRLGDGARAAREAHRLTRARAAGLPVPGVLEVRVRQGAPELVLEAIPGARALGAFLDAGARSRGLAQRLGELLALAHTVGLRHRDAHAGNVVIDGAGRPWLVDLAAARIGRPALAADVRRDLVRLGADLRERASPGFRARVVARWWRCIAPQLRSELGSLRALLEALEPEVRAARRAWVLARVPVHRRESSATRAVAGGVERRDATPDATPGASDGVGQRVLVGPDAERAYATAVRLELHRIPALRPLRLEFGPPARATLGALASAGPEPRQTTKTHERPVPARALGALAGALLDRGLAPADAQGAPRWPHPDALLSEAAQRDLVSREAERSEVLLGGRDGAAALLALATVTPATFAELLRSAGPEWRALFTRRRARAAFVSAALAAWRGTHAERDALRSDLLLERPRHGAAAVGARGPGAPTADAGPPHAPLPPPLRRRVRAQALQVAVRGAAWVPPRATAALAGLGARLASHGARGRLARENLALALGVELDDAARRAVLSAAARFAGRQLAEWLRLARGGDPDSAHAARGAWIDAAVELDPSIARLDAVLAQGRGAIVVTAHLGNWELLSARLRRRGQQGAVVGRVRRRDPSHAWLNEMRAAYGVETIAQDASPRRALEVLRGGGVLGLLCDLHVRRLDHILLPFLGRPAPTMTAPAAFARAHGAPLVPIRCVAAEAGRGRYRLVVDEPLALDPNLERSAATRDLLLRLNEVYARWIRATPEQWAWHQPRW